MERETVITFDERDNMIVTDAKIMFKNFTGVDRTKWPNHNIKTFSLVVPDNYADMLNEKGYNISIFTPKNGDETVHLLSLKLAYKATKEDRYNPRAFLHVDGNEVLLDVDTIDQVQNAYIIKLDFVASKPWGDNHSCFVNRCDIYIEGNPYARNMPNIGEAAESEEEQ